MKKLLTTLTIIAIAVTVSAQRKPAQYKGTWVIESTIDHPKVQTIKYYDENLDLLFQEKVEGKKLNISRAKVQAKLNSKLDELILRKGTLARNKAAD